MGRAKRAIEALAELAPRTARVRRDGEVIEAAEKAGITMYLTGARHFFHG